MERAVITIALLTASLGPLWCASGERAQAQDRVKEAAKESAEEAAEEAEGAAKETIGKQVDATKKAVEESVGSAKKQAQETAERAAEHAKEQAQEAAESLSEHAHDVAESAKELADELVVGAREHAQQLVAGAAGVGVQGQTAANDLMQRVRDETRKALIGMAAALDNRAQESRRAARKASWDKLKVRFLLTGDRPTMVLSEELRNHEYRVARLQRARELASAVSDQSAVTRSERLLEAEYARHKRRLDQLRKQQREQEAEAQSAAHAPTVEAHR